MSHSKPNSRHTNCTLPSFLSYHHWSADGTEMDNQDSGRAFCIYHQSTCTGEPAVCIEGHMRGPRRGPRSMVRHVRLSSHYCFFVWTPADPHRCLFTSCKHPNRMSLKPNRLWRNCGTPLWLKGVSPSGLSVADSTVTSSAMSDTTSDSNLFTTQTRSTDATLETPSISRPIWIIVCRFGGRHCHNICISFSPQMLVARNTKFCISLPIGQTSHSQTGHCQTNKWRHNEFVAPAALTRTDEL